MARQRRTTEIQGGAAPRASIWSRLRERFSLPGLEAWSTTMRTVFINALFLMAIIIVFPVIVSQFQRDQVIIEPIVVPESLSNQGMTSDVAASRVWDGLQDVARAAQTSKESIVAIPGSRRVEFSFPDSGFSIESLVFHLRRLFNAYETRISGEFICADQACERAGMRLRLRVIRNGVDIVDLPPMGAKPEREYFADAASGVLAVLDPFVALAASAEKQPLKATILARRLIRTHHKDAKWAHNLVGLIRYRANDVPAAIEEYRAAIALDPAFLTARANLGNALRSSGDLTGAQAEFDEIRRRDASNVFAAEGLAEVALARGKTDVAVADLLEAAELDPVNPRFFMKAGKIQLEAGKRDEGVALLTRSLELDPGYLPAFAVLAAMHLGNGDDVAAEKIFRDAADYAPEDADAQASHGRMLAILKDWNGARERYGRAVALEPANAGYWIEYARMLQYLSLHDQALAALATALKLEPSNAQIYMSMGDSYRDTGRKADALTAYKTYIDLDKEKGPMHTVIVRFIEILSAELAANPEDKAVPEAPEPPKKAIPNLYAP